MKDLLNSLANAEANLNKFGRAVSLMVSFEDNEFSIFTFISEEHFDNLINELVDNGINVDDMDENIYYINNEYYIINNLDFAEAYDPDLEISYDDCQKLVSYCRNIMENIKASTPTVQVMKRLSVITCLSDATIKEIGALLESPTDTSKGCIGTYQNVKVLLKGF